MRWTVCAAVAFASACSSRTKPGEPPDACLALPATVRASLVADPEGSALYWLEQPQLYDFNAALASYWRLVRFDLKTRRTEVLLEPANGPLAFFQGHLIATHGTDRFHVVRFDADARVQELTPTYLDVIDIEILDTHTFVFLADGDGERAVYALDLAEPRPRYLFDADVLLSTSGSTIYARADDDGIAYDAETGERKPFPPIDNALPDGDQLVFVEDKRVQSQRMTSGETRTLIPEPRDWKLRHQAGSVLARTAPGDKSLAYLVASGRATKLPTIVGGASILATASVGTHTWALIGHNTSNYTGDLADTNAETDVCMLPADGEVSFPTRQVPARYLSSEQRFFEAFYANAKGSLQVLEDRGTPTTLSMQLANDPGGSNEAYMRKRTRELHERVTSLVGELELRTDVIFSDRRRGTHRWRRDRLRYRTGVGMGDALLTDAADFDVEVSKLDNKRNDKKISCKGVLHNSQEKPLDDLVIKCSGNRSHVIKVGTLTAGATHAFDQTFDTEYGEAAYLEVLAGGKLLEVRDLDVEDRMKQVFELAVGVYDATELSLDEHEVEDDDITITLRAENRFLERDRTAQEAAITTAYEKYEALRGIYHVDAKSSIRLRVNVELSDVSFTYDGSRLRRYD